MKKKKIYETPEQFRLALLKQVRSLAQNDGTLAQRLQRQVAYDRLLCRLFSDSKVHWILKGGHAMELRIQKSRATKDIDLALKETKFFDSSVSNDEKNQYILGLLQEKASLNLNDFFEFLVSPSTLDLNAAPYRGGRYPVQALINGKIFARFHVDVAIGDFWIEPVKKIDLKDWLKFADIKTIKVPIISVEQHFAEKLHTYTLPREGILNSRAKDLVDLILLIDEGYMDSCLLKTAIKETFKRRATHALQIELPPPPKDWEKPFHAMAKECELNYELTDAFSLLKVFWEKIRRGILNG